MPYQVEAKGGGYQVTTPNHPQGFSKEPKSKEGAIKQMVAIKLNSGEDASGKKVGVRTRPTGKGDGAHHTSHSANTKNSPSMTSRASGAALIERHGEECAEGEDGECCPTCGGKGHGVAAHIEGTAPPREAPCAFCGGMGHDASAHRGGKALPMPARGQGEGEQGPSGPGLEQDRATQIGHGGNSPQTTGNANYSAPGSAGGMT